MIDCDAIGLAGVAEWARQFAGAGLLPAERMAAILSDVAMAGSTEEAAASLMSEIEDAAMDEAYEIVCDQCCPEE